MREKTESLLEVCGISNHYEGRPLLQNVSFSLKKGEILCLLGPSGSGKTTLLRILGGLEKEETGTVRFRGLDLRPVPPHRRGIGMMFQEYALFPHKTVWENVAFGLEMQRQPKEVQAAKIVRMLELVGLSGFEQRRVDELSGGERQRVALARSLAPEPELLLLDEPLGSLDRTLRDRLTTEIRVILKSLEVTAVFVTHDQAEAFSVADKVAILHNGVLEQFDTPENVYRIPCSRSVARFLGFTNFLEPGQDVWNLYAAVQNCMGNGLDACSAGVGAMDKLLLIRPDGAALFQPEYRHLRWPQLEGSVTVLSFLGASYKVTVESHGIMLNFELPLDPKPPAPGENIRLFINPSALVLMGNEQME